MAKIVIDGRMYNELGIGRYIRNLLAELQKIDKKNEYIVLHLQKDYERAVYKDNFKKVLANFKWYGVSEQVKLPKILNQLKPDLVHFPHFNIPIFYQGKFIVTIHDLIHQHFQMERATTHGPLIYKVKKIGYQAVFKSAVNRSSKIITPSLFVKNQLVKEWNINGDKIEVTPEGIDNTLFSIEKKVRPKNIQKILDKFKIKPSFIYYAGNAHPHKNIEGLIKSFLILRKSYKQSLPFSGEKGQYLTLVLSGKPNYFWEQIKRKYSHKDIIYTGFVTDEELVALYKSAGVYVVPSFEEGFGIPLLEAMALGCPVAASNRASLPEVGGEAALYFDPKDIEDMSSKIGEILNNQKLRKQLIEKGQKRVKECSWQKMAKQTLEIYNAV